MPEWRYTLAGGVAVAVLLTIGVILLLPNDDPHVVVEPIEGPRRDTIDVALFRSPRPRRIVIAAGECRIREPDGTLGAFDVQLMVIEGLTIRLCPFRDETTAEAYCEHRQRVELSCRSAAVVERGRDERRLGRTLRAELRGNGIALIASIDLETYVDSVVRSEHPRAPYEAQRAQAIVARTFARHANQFPRHLEAPVCDSTHCQVYRGAPIEVAGPSAAQSTGGAVLLDEENRIVPTFFHSTCGGRTLAADTVWPGTNAPSIVGVSDVDENGRAWCRDSRYFSWRYDISEADLKRALSEVVGRPLDGGSLRLKGSNGGQSWRIGDRNGTIRVRGAKVHRVLGRRIGWDHIRSPKFVAKRVGKKFKLRGVGLGHGVGLCQTGAEGRANAGQNAEAILNAYFPKLTIGHIGDALVR